MSWLKEIFDSFRYFACPRPAPDPLETEITKELQQLSEENEFKVRAREQAKRAVANAEAGKILARARKAAEEGQRSITIRSLDYRGDNETADFMLEDLRRKGLKILRLTNNYDFLIEW